MCSKQQAWGLGLTWPFGSQPVSWSFGLVVQQQQLRLVGARGLVGRNPVVDEDIRPVEGSMAAHSHPVDRMVPVRRAAVAARMRPVLGCMEREHQQGIRLHASQSKRPSGECLGTGAQCKQVHGAFKTFQRSRIWLTVGLLSVWLAVALSVRLLPVWLAVCCAEKRIQMHEYSKIE
jgi:hypothetical protein